MGEWIKLDKTPSFMVYNLFPYPVILFAVPWKLDFNKMENGMLDANLVPINQVTKFEAHFH